MPQLDHFAYISQVIWISSVFLGIYFMVVKSILPTIYKSLYNRRLLFVTLRKSVFVIETEIFAIKWLYITKFGEVLNMLKQLPEKLVVVVNKDVEKYVKGLHQLFAEYRDADLMFFSDKEILVDLYYCQVIDNDVNLSVADKQNWKREFLKK